MNHTHTQQDVEQAAAILHDLWLNNNRCDGLPAHLQPTDRATGYAVQAALSCLNKQDVCGWKIAAVGADRKLTHLEGVC